MLYSLILQTVGLIIEMVVQQPWQEIGIVMSPQRDQKPCKQGECYEANNHQNSLLRGTISEEKTIHNKR